MRHNLFWRGAGFYGLGAYSAARQPVASSAKQGKLCAAKRLRIKQLTTSVPDADHSAASMSSLSSKQNFGILLTDSSQWGSTPPALHSRAEISVCDREACWEQSSLSENCIQKVGISLGASRLLLACQLLLEIVMQKRVRFDSGVGKRTNRSGTRLSWPRVNYWICQTGISSGLSV